MKRKLLNETLNLIQKVYNTKSGKSPLLIYIDNKTSDNTYEIKDTLKKYGMDYLPNVIKGKYTPHSWGWVLWDGENDKKMRQVKAFLNDLPTIEKQPEDGSERGFNEMTGGLEKVVQEILRSIEAAEKIESKGLDEETKQRIDDFKNKLQTELGNEETQNFIKALIEYRTKLKMHDNYKYGWANMLTAYFMTGGRATELRPVKQWESMNYKIKDGAVPIPFIGTGNRYVRYTEKEKKLVIKKYLESRGVDSIEELPPSARYDLENRKLRGKPIHGTEYHFMFNVYDKQDVIPLEGAETPPEEPEDNWWWDKKNSDEKDAKLTEALIAFAQSDECGNITIKADNTQEGLGGARGNATNTGVINLIDDGKMRFPTAVHELTHQLRHWEYASANNTSLKRFYNRWADREIREQEAELCAAFVIDKYGYDIQPHLNYVFNWGLGKSNCSKIFDQIADVADFIEKGIQKYLNNNGTR